jgi:hypothetical protein
MRNELGYLDDLNTDGLSFGDPGTTEVRRCGVCGAPCAIERNINGPTSWAGAMMGRKWLHDVFKCPHYDFEWHKLAYRLAKEYAATVSARLRALIELDLDGLVERNIHLVVQTDSHKTYAMDED